MIDNPNKNNFFNKVEMDEREKFIPILKARILLKIKDLDTKIQNEEPFPEDNITIEDLMNIDDQLEEILNNWYY